MLSYRTNGWCVGLSRACAVAVSSLVVVITFTGCDRFLLPKPPQTQEGAYLVHVVSGGEAREDISTILLWYTGAEENLAAVQNANPAVDLGDLKPGQRVMIPSSLVTQTNAMPRRKFTLGVDAVPTPRPVSAPETAQSGKKADPLEELMRRNEVAGSPTPVPSRSLGDAVPTPAQLDSLGVPAVRPQGDSAPLERKKSGEAPKLESFSDDEIGVLSDASANAKGGVDVTSKNASRGDASEQPSVEIKNPRPKRKLQPEVFDEE